MKVQIIRSRLEDENSKTGVGTYGDLIESLLRDTGNEVDVISFEITIDEGIRNTLRFGLIEPLGRIIMGRKGTDVVHSVFEYCSIYLPFTKTKRVVTFHHVVEKDEKNSKKWFLTWRFSAWMSIIFADKIIAVSSQTEKELLRKYSISPDKIEVITHIPNGFEVRNDISKEHIIGCMGTINERKNFASAVRVFGSILEDNEFEDYKMIICGKGPMKEKLLEQIRYMELEDKVSFVQDISKDEMVKFYNRCSLILNTSMHEGVGLATIEAQMCGTPVLYFSNAKMPEEVMKAAVPCSDEADMSEKAKTLLKEGRYMDRIIREGLEFTKTMGNDFRERTMAIYNSLIEGHR